MAELKLGCKAKDVVTGFTGILTAKTEYLNGCVQYDISGRAKPDGGEARVMSVDAEQIKYVAAGLNAAPKPKAKPKPRRGGPSTSMVVGRVA